MPAPKKVDDNQAIGRSQSGLSTKIHALVDALGHFLKMMLTAEQVHDLATADVLLPELTGQTLIADKAYEADKRVIKVLAGAGRKAMIPPKANRRH